MHRRVIGYLLAIAAISAAATAVADERSASWYADHPKERAAVSTLCKEYASQARSNPNCDNAFQGNLIAGEREARQRTQTAQRDPGVSNLGTSLEYWRNPANAENRAFWAKQCKMAEARGASYETLQGMWCPAIKATGGVLTMDPLAQIQADNAAITAGSTSTVDINWQLFRGVFAAVDGPLTNALNPALETLIGHVNPILKTLLTVYIIAIGLQMAIAPSGSPIRPFLVSALRGAVIVALLANTATFNEWIGDVFLKTLPNEIGAALNGPVGGGGINGGSQFDDVWNQAYTSGLMVYKNLPSLSFKGALLSLLVFAFWAVALAAVAIGFLMFLASHVLIALLIIVGPIFVACALFEASRQYFIGWLSTCISTVVSQVLVVALMSLMIRIETSELSRLSPASTGANEVGQIGALLGVAALLGICAWLARQIPNVAVGIAGGAYHQLGSYVGAAAAAVKKVGSVSRSAASAIASRVGTATTSSFRGFAGRSLSGGRQ